MVVCALLRRSNAGGSPHGKGYHTVILLWNEGHLPARNARRTRSVSPYMTKQGCEREYHFNMVASGCKEDMLVASGCKEDM